MDSDNGRICAYSLWGREGQYRDEAFNSEVMVYCCVGEEEEEAEGHAACHNMGRSLVEQLERMGFWHWAIYVALWAVKRPARAGAEAGALYDSRFCNATCTARCPRARAGCRARSSTSMTCGSPT